jgi:hypothetical protein
MSVKTFDHNDNRGVTRVSVNHAEPGVRFAIGQFSWPSGGTTVPPMPTFGFDWTVVDLAHAEALIDALRYGADKLEAHIAAIKAEMAQHA